MLFAFSLQKQTYVFHYTHKNLPSCNFRYAYICCFSTLLYYHKLVRVDYINHFKEKTPYREL